MLFLLWIRCILKIFWKTQLKINCEFKQHKSDKHDCRLRNQLIIRKIVILLPFFRNYHQEFLEQLNFFILRTQELAKIRFIYRNKNNCSTAFIFYKKGATPHRLLSICKGLSISSKANYTFWLFCDPPKLNHLRI